MKDFADIFGLGSGFFNPRGNLLTREDFMQDVGTMRIPFTEYEACKSTLLAMLGLKTGNNLDL